MVVTTGAGHNIGWIVTVCQLITKPAKPSVITNSNWTSLSCSVFRATTTFPRQPAFPWFLKMPCKAYPQFVLNQKIDWPSLHLPFREWPSISNFSSRSRNLYLGRAQTTAFRASTGSLQSFLPRRYTFNQLGSLAQFQAVVRRRALGNGMLGKLQICA